MYTLADVVVWSQVALSQKLKAGFVTDQVAGKWFSRLSALPEFSQAAAKYELALKGDSKAAPAGGEKQANKAPKEKAEKKAAEKIQEVAISKVGLGYFRYHIAQGVAKISEYTPEQVYPLLETPKSLEHGDFALPMPKLNSIKKIPGNPATLCSEWAAKVCHTGPLAILLGFGFFFCQKLTSLVL